MTCRGCLDVLAPPLHAKESRTWYNSKGQNSNEKVSQSAKPRIRITDDKNIRSHTRRSRSHNDLRYMYTNVDTLHNKKAELMTRILGAWELCETGLTINGYTSYSDLSIEEVCPCMLKII